MISAGTLGSLNAKRAKKKKERKGRPLKDGISYHCRKGVHTDCFSLKCECKCGHMGVNRK